LLLSRRQPALTLRVANDLHTTFANENRGRALFSLFRVVASAAALRRVARDVDARRATTTTTTMRAMRCVAMAKPEPSSRGRRASASGPGGGKSSASNVPRRRGGGGKAAWGEGAKRAGKRPSDGGATIAAKEKHLYFDEAQIIVVGGQGGEGESWTGTSKPKVVKNFKYQWGRNLKKYIELPAAEPADGGRGGNVYLRVDRTCDSLLHLHERKTWRAKKGYHGSAAEHASGGRERHRVAPDQEHMYIPVPPGTVVRRKRTGELLGDMTKHGQTLLVAEGGGGGLAARRQQRQVNRKMRNGKEEDFEASDIAIDTASLVSTVGEDGEELSIELLMRVVADCGLVGLPNVGKSSLLKAVTRASPEIANYAFTTLMPNLGVIKTEDDLAPTGESSTVMADLPGLIEGAHKGLGLGRAFLRHLRRTRSMVCVVDASGQDPVSDYVVVRQELKLYNPEYVKRPHILVLNKTDLEWAALRTDEITQGIKALDEETIGDQPVAILPISAKEGTGVPEFMSTLDKLMKEEDARR
jgi:Obg family GTPase CgtA